MIIDARALSYTDAFKQLKDAIACNGPQENELLVFFESSDEEKCSFIKGFAEILLDCETTLREAAGYRFLKISRQEQGVFN